MADFKARWLAGDYTSLITTVIAHAGVVIVSSVSPLRNAKAMRILAVPSVVIIILPPWIRVPPPAIKIGKASLSVPVTWVVRG